MNTLDALNTFMGWLGRTSLQAAVLALMILLVQALTRDRIAPRWRHALWFLLIARLMLPWAPPHRMSVYNLMELAGRSHTSATTNPAQPLAMTSSGESGRSGLRPDSGISSAPATSVAPVSPTASVRESFWTRVGSKTRPTLLASIWLGGFLAFIGAAIWQSFALGRAMRGRRAVTDQRLLDLLESCKEAMGFRVWLMVIETPDVNSPALLGFVRPKLLIPAGAIDDLGLGRLRHVFLHELAHLRRHDIAWNWLATLLLAAHWFNPLIWYAFHRMRADQELACDQLALSSIQPAETTAYGRTIIHLLEKFSEPARMPGLAGILEDQNQMKRRISMIAKFKAPSAAWSAVAILLMCALGCVALTNATNKSQSACDLVINDLFVLNQNGGNNLVASIVNNGSSTSPIIGVWFYVNDPHRKNPIKATVSEIEPGKTFNEAVPIRLAEGVNRFEAVLDAEKTINMKDRANSSAAISKVVRNGKVMDLSAPAGESESISGVDLEMKTPPRHMASSNPAAAAFNAAADLYVKNKFGRALDGFGTALGRNPTADQEIEIKYWQAIATYRADHANIAQAEQRLEKIVAEHKRSPRAWDSLCALAELRYAEGDFAGALKYCQVITNVYPDYPGIEQVKAVVRKIESSKGKAGTNE